MEHEPELELDLSLDFSDITILETNGIFKDVKDKMAEGFPSKTSWMIRSSLTVSSRFGMGEMLLHFYHNGNIYIMDYKASIGDVFYNPDIQAISAWARESGWNIPQPHADLIRENKEFWKYFYDTLLLDSDYLDDAYGKRPQLEEEENENGQS